MMKKFLIKVNGNQYEVEVEEVRDESTAAQPTAVRAPAAAATVEVPAPKAAEKVDKAVPAGAATITAPMPGAILRVNVNTGDMVKKGQVLLILEAMKMENEIVAPNDGKVASVNVKSGTSVNVGDVLVSLT
jgi:glutaconyl-CoA/methylmalonyl-CoA decarboxylase subunit gamma